MEELQLTIKKQLKNLRARQLGLISSHLFIQDKSLENRRRRRRHENLKSELVGDDLDLTENRLLRKHHFCFSFQHFPPSSLFLSLF